MPARCGSFSPACAWTGSVEELQTLPVDVLSWLRPIPRLCATHRRTLTALLVALSFVPVAIALRSQIERRASSVALHGLRRVGAWVARPPQAPPDAEEFLPLLPQLGGVSQPGTDRAAAAQSGSQPGPKKNQRLGPAHKWAAPPILPEPVSRRAQAAQVLSWVQARLMPGGRTREAGFGLPAGIELSGVAGLGIGLLDGDRLVAVDGAPVSERAQVVSLVLAARGRHAPQLVATLGRRTASGPRTFSVTVEQPYLTDDDRERGAATGSSAPPDPSGAPARAVSP